MDEAQLNHKMPRRPSSPLQKCLGCKTALFEKENLDNKENLEKIVIGVKMMLCKIDWIDLSERFVGITVYCVALHQPIGSSLIGHHCTADVRVMSDRTVTLVLFQLTHSTSIFGIHTAT